MDGEHVPVLAAEAIELLAPARGGLFVDATVGLGGHARRLLAEGGPALRLVGIDRDPEALARAEERLAEFGPRVRLAEGDFGDLGERVAEALAVPPGSVAAAGVLADLGVSSLQLDSPHRGFAFRHAGPLDMRMGRGGPTAAEVVNRYGEAELERIVREYGEDWQARRIARALVAARRAAPILTTARLAEVVREAKGTAGRARAREGRIDPATRVFQALRIEVNQELAQLERFLDEAVRLLAHDGRLVVISYHSLEDRIVKNTLRDLARGEVDEATGRPRAETRAIEVLTKKPLRPSAAELDANPRSRSARLRAARRLA